MKLPKPLKIIAIVIGCEMVGILGSYFTFSSIPTWYAYLNKPFFNPPNWIFGPVWTLLYAMMGFAAFVIWEKAKNKTVRKKAMRLFGFQLFLNGIWTPIFFGLKNLLFALLVIIALWVLILLTIEEFHKIEKKAAYLLVPYLLWVTFATLLNLAILILN